MPVESEAEQRAMLADHGYPAIWTPAGGGPAPAITAIFDAEYVSVAGGDEPEISSVGPTLLALTVDVVGVKVRDGFTTEAPHAAAEYEVVDRQPASADGVYTRLFLHKV